MSKGFDKVWYKGLIFKLKQNGTDFLKLVNYLLGLILNQVDHKGVYPWPIVIFDIYIYINDLSEGLTTNVKLFADDVSLFTLVDNNNLSATNLNSDLSKVNAWASQWKMTVNSDPNKQAQKVISSHKIKKASQPPLNLIITLLCKCSFKNIWAFIWTIDWTFVNIFEIFLKW